MTDNTTLPGTGEVYASDDISGVKFQRVKITSGPDGINDGDVSKTNPLPVTTSNSVAAYGENVNAEEISLVHIKFAYGINPRLIRTAINGVGSVTAADSLAICSTGTTINSQAALFSRVSAEAQPGIGISGKFTTLYNAPTAGTEQIHGIGNASDGFFFGFKGTVFGVHLHANGAEHVHEFEITAAATGTDNITITLDGDAQTVAITSGDTEWDVARAILAAASSFAMLGEGWLVRISGKFVQFVSFTAEPRIGTFSYGAGTTGTTATLSTLLAGKSVLITTIIQANWNQDKMNGLGASGATLNHDKLTVYKIQFQSLGAGAIEFYVESDIAGTLILVHRINYSGNNILPSVQNPTLPLYMMSRNIANNTDIVMKSDSMALFSQGKIKPSALINIIQGGQLIPAGIETVILVINFPQTFNGKPNRTIVNPISFNVETDGTKGVSFKVYPNPAIGGSPVYNEVFPGVSAVEFANNTGISAIGTPFFEKIASKIDAQDFDLTSLALEGVAGDKIAITALSDNSSNVKVSILFSETQ